MQLACHAPAANADVMEHSSVQSSIAGYHDLQQHAAKPKEQQERQRTTPHGAEAQTIRKRGLLSKPSQLPATLPVHAGLYLYVVRRGVRDM